MPTYEYACQSCGRHVEVFQKFSEDPLTTCEACGGPLRKVFHPAGILFKGSGFYATDSRRSGSSKPGESKKDKDPSTSGDSKKDSSKSESSSSSSSDSSSSKKDSSSSKSTEKSA
jgi:putative FmdB family regulatory protein